MTVSELIEQLKEMPQDLDIYIYADHGQMWEESRGAERVFICEQDPDAIYTREDTENLEGMKEVVLL